jgi:hypothetical protein
MNPVDLVDKELLNYVNTKPIVVIVGYTKTGKYPIAKKIAD